MNAFRFSGALLIGLMLVAPCAAVPASDQVRQGYESLDQWLGGSDQADRWHRYLLSDVLEKQLSASEPADPRVLARILARYESNVDGLESDRFQEVRGALRNWIETLGLPEAEALPDLAEQSKDEYQQVTDRDVALGKHRVAVAVQRLERVLSRSPHEQQWKQYLQWDALQEQLAGGAETDVSQLVSIYRRYTSDNAGLEMPAFSRVAVALREYIDLASWASLPEPREAYESALDDLSEYLKEYADSPSEELNFQIAQRLGWLKGTGQAPLLVEAVRARYSYPNFYARLSERLVAAGVEEERQEVEDVYDYILGTDISGTGVTRARVEFDLVPYTSRASAALYLRGITGTNTVGVNGPARIYSSGQTQFGATKQLYLSADGISTSPARSNVDTDTNIRSIDLAAGPVVSAIGRGIATRQAYQQKPQAERISSQHSSQKINRRFDREVDQQFAELNAEYTENVREPLLRMREFPELFTTRTTADYLYLKVLKANRFQLGAPSPPPELDTNCDLVAQVHESFANNLAAAVLANETLVDEELADLVEEITGEVPERFQLDPDEEPISITFGVQPLTLELAEGVVTLTIRGDEYKQGNRELPPMDVSVSYAVEQRDGGAVLVRKGDINIVPPDFEPGSDRLSVSEISLRTILRKKFGRMFPEEITSDGLVLPGEWEEVGPLRLDELSIDGGWAIGGWKMPR